MKGIQLDSLVVSHGLHQLISESTHLLPNSSSCTDLIFTDQPNLAVENGVHPSLHEIVYVTFNLMIEYLPPYQRLVRNFKLSDTNLIRYATYQVNREFLFFNKDVRC